MYQSDSLLFTGVKPSRHFPIVSERCGRLLSPRGAPPSWSTWVSSSPFSTVPFREFHFVRCNGWMERHERDFKGVWIPRDIWLSEQLSSLLKYLVAWVLSSLSCSCSCSIFRDGRVETMSMSTTKSKRKMVFQQLANECGGCIRKGERGACVIKWGRHLRTVKNGDGSEEERTVSFLRSYRVFNAVQMEGIEFPEVEIEHPLDAGQRIARAEQTVAQMPAAASRQRTQHHTGLLPAQDRHRGHARV